MEIAAQLSEQEAEALHLRLVQQDAQALMLRRLVKATDEPALPLSLEPDR